MFVIMTHTSDVAIGIFGEGAPTLVLPHDGHELLAGLALLEVDLVRIFLVILGITILFHISRALIDLLVLPALLSTPPGSNFEESQGEEQGKGSHGGCGHWDDG